MSEIVEKSVIGAILIDPKCVENNAEYFEKVVQDTEKFYQKYKTPFAKELGVAFVNEMERKYKHEYKMQGQDTGR